MNNTVLALEVTEHPEEYMGVGVIEISEDGGNLGRGSRSQITLPDVNKYVSSTHCLVTSYGGEFFINDVSTNGTYINGNKLEKNQPTTLAEGDVLLVGRYKFTVRLENKFTGFRIDEDITPDVNVTDPLELIENQVPERNHALEEPLRSLVEELNGEPQIDSEDPLDLLVETSEHEDLIGRVEMTPDPDPFRSQMQLADDSNDVQAEMPMPIIPDDWFDSLSEPQSNVSDAAKKIQVTTKEQSVEPSPAVRTQVDQLVPFSRQEQPSREFEHSVDQAKPALETPHTSVSVADDIDFTSMSRDLVKSNESINFVEQAATTNKSTALALNQQLSSFLRGLGLDADAARNNDEWFESLGESIRLCLGDLVKQLNNAQEHNTQHTSEPTDTDQMLNLMQKLHSDHEVMPSEFFEEMLLDTENLRERRERSMYQVTQGVLNDLHPENFKQHSALGMKAHHSWKAYQAFYSEHFDQTERQIVSMLKDKIALECDKMRSNQ